MRKVLIVMLLTGLCFAGTQEKKVDTTPKLTSDQQVEILGLATSYEEVQKSANEQLSTLQKKYADYTKDLCKSTDGKKYTVDPGNFQNGHKPFCKEVVTPAEKK